MANVTQKLHDKLNGPNKKTRTNSLKFPSDIETHGNKNIVLFTIFTQSGSQFEDKGAYRVIDGQARYYDAESSSIARHKLFRQVKKIDTTISMFVPGVVQENNSVGWRTTEMGLAGDIADTGVSMGDNLMSQNWKIFKDKVGEGFINTASGALQALTPINAKDAAELLKGSISNPYMEVVFEGVSNRTFSFTFKMTPKNRKEAEEIRKIVNVFKFHQMPEHKYPDQTGYLLYPSLFDITFINDYQENKWLGKISTCALTNVSVSRGGVSEYTTFDDGSPQQTTLTVDFTELEVMTKNRLESFGEM